MCLRFVVYTVAQGADLDTAVCTPPSRGFRVKQIWTSDPPARPTQDTNKRAAERRPVTLPARLTWKDQRGAARFATVVTRNVSEYGVYIECSAAVSIPLFRLVQFQLERDARDESLPDALRQGRVLSAVYRVNPGSASKPQGLALRLMVDPRRQTIAEPTRATA